MTTVRMLFLLGAAFLALPEVRAAPTRYDQRQEGSVNAQVKLENLLFVVAVPNLGGPLTEAALGALDQMISRSKNGLFKSGEGAHQNEPFSVEIVQLNENLDKDGSVRKAEEDAGTSSVSDQRATPVGYEPAGGAERVARNVKNFEFPKSREVPAVPGYFASARKPSRPKTGSSGRARNVVGNAWTPDVEPGRPGTSLKKQLPQTGEEDVAPSAGKNDVSPLAEEKQQELRLLGDGVENCGPGRRRDASGVCQFDGPAGSHL
ncbi:PREDICTED: uncharacterized protein LOC105567750 [Vollenhovia emeryi]|uniref:uncharacterized protein LOC105567750 n=1 Tax=Vollenhovia emeryi TaxID=411798 RepID=UPI0005F5034D|nr:PREDICTED: uncharacterized protein LOC105567750 [Vollenhovia emeryi]